MDEQQFLTLILSKVRLVMGAISDKRPLLSVAGMILDRQMDERE